MRASSRGEAWRAAVSSPRDFEERTILLRRRWAVEIFSEGITAVYKTLLHPPFGSSDVHAFQPKGSSSWAPNRDFPIISSPSLRPCAASLLTSCNPTSEYFCGQVEDLRALSLVSACLPLSPPSGPLLSARLDADLKAVNRKYRRPRDKRCMSQLPS